MKKFKPFTFLGDYIDGRFIIPKDATGSFESTNPGDLSDKIASFSYSYSHVPAAVEAAKKAFESWRKTPLEKRISHLKKLYVELKANTDHLAELISRETGKPLWEATQESKALLGKINITIEESLKLIADKNVPNAAGNIPGKYRFKPKGVMVVIGPFNFPAHLPHGHYIPALLTGNTVIFKPSELTPAVAQFITELFHRANFPAGVFNLIQGEKEIGKRLCLEKHVDGILFTGSYEVGLRIKTQVATHFWKSVVLEMGGKNASIVLDDAPFEKAIYENIKGAFLTTGQRCSATSRLIVTEKIANKFIEKFHQVSKSINIGYAFLQGKDQPFMGPLISKAALDKYTKFQGIAERDGAETIMRGRPLELKPSGYYVTPSIYRIPPHKKDSTYLQTEIFGPSVAIMVVRDLEEAVSIANETDYGLVVSIFSKEKANYEQVFEDCNTGLVNWNRSTVGASSKLPFGGNKKSGNYAPTALFAPYYCTYPVASLEDPSETFDPATLVGIPYDANK